MNGDNVSEKLLTKKELSQATGLKVSFIEKARRKFGLPSYKLGGLVRFKISDYEVWLKQRKSA